MITPREQDDVSEFRDIMIQGEYTGINEWISLQGTPRYYYYCEVIYTLSNSAAHPISYHWHAFSLQFTALE